MADAGAAGQDGLPVLPDRLGPGLDVVFCGTAPGLISADRGHYYAGPGNRFWTYLHEAGFVAVPLSPADDAGVLDHGIGLTDLVKTMAQSHDRGLPYDAASLERKVREHRPRWIAFTSKEAGKAAARHAGERPPALGRQEWTFGGARVFVLPSPSGRNQGREAYDGRGTRLEWWAECARLVRDA
ncbi:mismatch-specific DNA-glycosylase [Demequina sp. NBRC 110057]|uniref:mismatch-specific DNA-glycosylase n=1 Tax=Demequina sp. NBRC 110057 TaxID=1570346 RepID=UPI000A03F519|nr:mismatch-specific DNA-glycosylase [Demequina sp. NBRC 110057]